MSSPTWPNHLNIFRNAGMNVMQHPYWNPETKDVDFPAMCDSLAAAPAGSIVLLHACAHNPTGNDPTRE